MVEEVARAAAVSHKLAGAEVLECFGTGKIVPGETRKLIASELEAVLCPVVAVGLARLPVGVRDSRPAQRKTSPIMEQNMFLSSGPVVTRFYLTRLEHKFSTMSLRCASTFLSTGERNTPVSPCPCALLGAVVEADPKREAAAARKHDRHSITLLRRVDGGERAPICDALDLSPPPTLEPWTLFLRWVRSFLGMAPGPGGHYRRHLALSFISL